MYYHYPSTGGSAYVLWKRLLYKRKTGIGRVRRWREYSDYDVTIDGILETFASIGDLSAVIFLIQQGGNPTADSNYAIQMACKNGHLQVAKWLYNKGCDPTAGNNYAIRLTSRNGHLNVTKWLYSVGCDPTVMSNAAIRWASEKGHLHVVKWLYSVGCSNSLALCNARRSGHQKIVDFLLSVGCVDSTMKDFLEDYYCCLFLQR